jgi:serine/threonine protein kinase
VIALNYLHSKDIVYRDLKPENIMIDRQGFIKLSDFGLSKKLKPREENVFSIMGMPEYTAPEILLKRDCTKAVDFWCLGSLLLEMITGFPPFYSENLNELYDSIKSEPFAIDEEQKLSSDCVNLL